LILGFYFGREGGIEELLFLFSPLNLSSKRNINNCFEDCDDVRVVYPELKAIESDSPSTQ